jgi:recombinational DNA repair protein (RecF pathway)
MNVIENKTRCAKCKSSIDMDSTSTYIEGGESYPFCKKCSDILETFPIPANIIRQFLTPEQQQSQVQRNIFAARKQRTEGKKILN